MSDCECGGTGFVGFVGDYQMPNGAVVKHVEQVKRCPEWKRYFDSSPLMRDYPHKVPVRKDAGCSAAIRAHAQLFERAETKRKDDKAL